VPVVCHEIEAPSAVDDLAGVADHHSSSRNVLDDHGAGSDRGIVSHLDAADEYRIRADVDAIAEPRNPVTGASLSHPNGDTLGEIAVGAKHCSRVNDDWPEMANVQARSDLCLCGETDARHDLAPFPQENGKQASEGSQNWSFYATEHDPDAISR
jgi:hypothetical protein